MPIPEMNTVSIWGDCISFVVTKNKKLHLLVVKNRNEKRCLGKRNTLSREMRSHHSNGVPLWCLLCVSQHTTDTCDAWRPGAHGARGHGWNECSES